MPPRQAPRRREVVANALRVLPDVERVGADGVAGELDDRRIADADGVKRKRSTLPADGGLIQPSIIGHAAFDLIDRPRVEHVRKGARVFRRRALACAARRWMARRAAARIVERVVRRHADVEPARRRELIVKPSQRLICMRDEFLVDVEKLERACIGVGLRLALELVRAEEVDSILLDRTAERRAHLLVGVRQHGVLSGYRIDLNEIR